jgi:hypothetical protein
MKEKSGMNHYNQGLIGYKSLEKVSEQINNNHDTNPSKANYFKFFTEKNDSNLKELEKKTIIR